MDHIYKDQLTTLHTAAECQEVAANSEYFMQQTAVARLINEAANCGQYTVKFNQPLIPELEDELKENGYMITRVGKANPDNIVMISWVPVVEGDERGL